MCVGGGPNGKESASPTDPDCGPEMTVWPCSLEEGHVFFMFMFMWHAERVSGEGGRCGREAMASRAQVRRGVAT